MNRSVRVIETYVPGLNGRSAAWYEALLQNVASSLRANGTEVALLAIPDDETLMWLVWSGAGSSDPEPLVRDAVSREAVAQGAVAIERAVDGLVAWREGDAGTIGERA
jgi:hypothetical protein